MKYLIAILFIGLIGLVVLSGCVASNQKDTNTGPENDQLTKISTDLNQNSTLNNTDNQISNDLNELNVDDNSANADALDINSLDTDLSQIDSLLQDPDPFTTLN